MRWPNGNTLKVAALVAAMGMGAMAAMPAQAADMKSWQQQVAKRIAENQSYPRSAQIRKIEGTAKVKMVIASSGTVSSFNVEESSGSDILDAEVEKLMTKINPLPATPDGNEMTLVVPLSWRLN